MISYNIIYRNQSLCVEYYGLRFIVYVGKEMSDPQEVNFYSIFFHFRSLVPQLKLNKDVR